MVRLAVLAAFLCAARAVPVSISSAVRGDLAALRAEAQAPDMEVDTDDRLVSVGRTGDAGEVCHACHYSSRSGGCSGREVTGICGDRGSCGGAVVPGHCNGNNYCCSSGGDGGSSDEPPAAPASVAGLTAPYPQASGTPGQNGGPCLQGQRGVCKAESECDTSAGFRLQRGRCAGSDFCCTPKNAGTNSDIIPNAFFEPNTLCYPLTQDSLTHTGSDFGNGRPRSSDSRRNKRCHAGQDLFTKSPGTVIAIADGEVTHVSNTFLRCSSGWGIRRFYGGRKTYAGAIYVYHPSIDRTINYGEADGDQNKVRRGSRVRKGQVLTRASVCGMLHFEVYQGRRSSNVRWWGSRACRDAANRGNAYGCSTPPRASENNYCAKYAMDVKDDATIDPRPYLELLAGKWCSPN